MIFCINALIYFFVKNTSHFIDIFMYAGNRTKEKCLDIKRADTRLHVKEILKNRI